ncbi:MAG: tyrosine--tRNA ligase [Candidatus Saccharibacteria bacterium]|nr:tyrosine--tRNA ligase [Candidatus Saccharibacteria bacterium]
MKLSEELKYRGFVAETTVKNIEDLDAKKHSFYLGADPSADSLTIGNLAALMMAACFIRHGYKPYLLVGGATGQIGDPKENSERELKSLEEVSHNKECITEQFRRIVKADDLTIVDNYDWFREIKYLDFLREVGKSFSMTQLLDRQFVQNRIGEGGAGISYAEFSYTLIQGYDFLHLYRKYGVDLQICGADQYGNASSGIHLIRRMENAEANVWSTPLVIDPVSGKKFGKSEGNAVWLAGSDNGGGNFTSMFDFYQFWINQADEAVENLLKIYTTYEPDEIESVMVEQKKAPEARVAQKMLARGVTEVVHGKELTDEVILLTEQLFSREKNDIDIDVAKKLLPNVEKSENILEGLVKTGLAKSKSEARKFIKGKAVSLNNEKITDENAVLKKTGILKKGKNKFAVVV